MSWTTCRATSAPPGLASCHPDVTLRGGTAGLDWLSDMQPLPRRGAHAAALMLVVWGHHGHTKSLHGGSHEMWHVRRSASVVFMKVNDLMLYLIGTGEYDELMRASLPNSL